MAKLQFKQKCKICNDYWVLIKYREYPICVKCQMKQVISEEITDKKYKFLDIEEQLYNKSRFLRNIRVSYNRYKELSEKQIEAFKKTVKDLKNPKLQPADEE